MDATLPFYWRGTLNPLQLNFFFTTTFKQLVEPNGLQKTVLFGASLCIFSLLCAFVFVVLERYADNKGFDPLTAGTSKKKARFSPALIKRFPRVWMAVDRAGRNSTLFVQSYWVLAVVLVTFYNVVFPFVADAPEFIEVSARRVCSVCIWHSSMLQEKYYGCGSDGTPCNSTVQFEASVIAGSPYYFSAVFSPLLGAFVDKFGKRGWMSKWSFTRMCFHRKLSLVPALTGSCLSLFVFLIAGLTWITPIVPMVILGKVLDYNRTVSIRLQRGKMKRRFHLCISHRCELHSERSGSMAFYSAPSRRWSCRDSNWNCYIFTNGQAISWGTHICTSSSCISTSDWHWIVQHSCRQDTRLSESSLVYDNIGPNT